VYSSLSSICCKKQQSAQPRFRRCSSTVVSCSSSAEGPVRHHTSIGEGWENPATFQNAIRRLAA
jgi:hypothetical protein